MGARLVLLDPGFQRLEGHHADVNRQLQAAAEAKNCNLEIWGDQALAVMLPDSDFKGVLRPQLRNGGYIDPRHWSDLPGCMHQAGLLRPQMQQLATGAPITGWMAHSLLPFQMLALAQLLQHHPPAMVVICLMFAPGEVFQGQPEFDLHSQRATASEASEVALTALGLACQRQGHSLLLAAGSQQLIDSYTPLCVAAGLAAPELHPSVVGLPAPAMRQTSGLASAQVLLHWGERKPDKGRDLALLLLNELISRQPNNWPEPWQTIQWAFHAAGIDGCEEQEKAILGQARLCKSCTVMEGVQERSVMEQVLADTELLLLPYDPEAYAWRSSGVLWLYGSCRHHCNQPARVMGFPGGWIATEAQAMGMAFIPLPQPLAPGAVLQALVAGLGSPGPLEVSSYGHRVLAESFPHWLMGQFTR